MIKNRYALWGGGGRGHRLDWFSSFKIPGNAKKKALFYLGKAFISDVMITYVDPLSGKETTVFRAVTNEDLHFVIKIDEIEPKYSTGTVLDPKLL